MYGECVVCGGNGDLGYPCHCFNEDIPMPKTFGDYAQSVLSQLCTAHGWDDPCSFMSLLFDRKGRVLDLLLQSYNQELPVDLAAEEINKEFFS